MSLSNRKLPISPFQSQISSLCLFLCLFSGCSPVYLFRVALEEGKILWRRQPIEQLLERGDLNADTREKLKLVLAVREFARDKLKFKVGGSYASYSYVDGHAPSYVLMAVPKIELRPYTWWYLFVGRVPYKGFPSEASAKAEADTFASQGYDTDIQAAAAFSTLGWFDDPLLAHLLEYDKVTLAEIIFHELLHNTLFVKGAVDFNESFANYVGYHAAVLFFREQYGPTSQEYLRAVEVWDQEFEFAKFLAELVRNLKDLYARDIELEDKLRLREEIFSGNQMEWARRVGKQPRHRHRGFSRGAINNAVIAHYLLYSSHLDLFTSLQATMGYSLGTLVQAVAKQVDSAQDPFAAVQAFLAQNTSGTAHSSAKLQ
jgi:predicted aminopeptidase